MHETDVPPTRYHLAGMYVVLSGLTQALLTSFPPRTWPQSTSSMLAAWKTLASMGYPVDAVQCPPTFLEMLHEYVPTTGSDFSLLSSHKIVISGGAVLSASIIADLVAQVVNICTMIGSTETGCTVKTTLPIVENSNVYGTLRVMFPQSSKIVKQEFEDEVYELTVHKGLDTAAETWLDIPADEPWHSGDLILEEPKGSGNWVLHGRKDDLLVHMDGNNMSAEAMQLDIRAASEVIKNAIVVGHARPCTALLVEVSENIDPNSKEIAEEI